MNISFSSPMVRFAHGEKKPESNGSAQPVKGEIPPLPEAQRQGSHSLARPDIYDVPVVTKNNKSN